MYFLGALFIVIVFFVVLRLASWMPPQPEPPCSPSRKSIITARRAPVRKNAGGATPIITEYQPRRFRWHALERSIQEPKKDKSPRKLDDYPF